MSGFFGQGIWIFLLLFLGCFLYFLWLVHKKLGDLKDRGKEFQSDLGEVLLRHRLAVGRMEEAAALVEAGRQDEAIEMLEQIRQTIPGLHALDFFLGKAYLAKGDPLKASTHLRTFLDKAKPYDRLSQERLSEAHRLLDAIRPKA
ncbi:MAG: hypothetical protein WHX93_13590 [bacterium]